MTHADEIWHSADILTMDPLNPRAEAMAVKDGKLIAVGQDNDVMNLCGPNTVRHNLHGTFVMPGIVEGHTHALWGACRDLFDVYVGYDACFSDLMSAVRKRIHDRSPGKVIHGGPWRHEMRPDMGPIPKHTLDALSDRHPIVLSDTSQHVIWCNSLALSMAGIGDDTPDIPGGVIERLPSGEPTGILAETAMVGVRDLVQRSDQELAEASRAACRYYNSLGITAFKEPMAYEADLRAYKAADERNDLSLHMAAHIVRQSPMSKAPVSFDDIERLRTDYASENIRTSFAKLFLDGVAPGFTASFIDPYLVESGYDAENHDPDATLLIPPDELNQTVIELDRRGFTVKMHACGDNAIRKGLDAIQAARQTNGASGLRHEIAHSVFVSDADLDRFKALQAIAEISPKLWYPNAATRSQRAVLGGERLEKVHRISDLIQAGAELIYGSDWPASAPDANPWTGLSGMLTRQNGDSKFGGTLGKAQAISLDTALPIFTRNGARSLGMETQTGSLSAGKWADFVVLGQSLFKLHPSDIAGIGVQQTVWKGRTVHMGPV